MTVSSGEQAMPTATPVVSKAATEADKELLQWVQYRRRLVDKIVILASSAFGLLFFGALFWVFVMSPNEDYLLVRILFGQFPAAVGLPAAAGMAFFVIWAFEASVGRMELKLGEMINFKGASTPVLFWIAAFLSIGYMIHLNWIK